MEDILEQTTSIAPVQDPMTLLRIDKNIAKQGVDFINTYGKEGQLIFDVFIYIANTFQKNLFNYGELDVKDFADKLGYSVSNLKRKHPKPFQSENRLNPLPDEEQGFSNVIENALYKASKINLEFTRKVKDYTNNEEIQEIEFYQLIKKLRKHTSMKRKDIYYYSFEISEVFTYHLSKYFTLSDIEVLKSLRKKNVVFLYLYLKTLQEAQRVDPKDKVNATPYFDVLCEKAEIQIQRPADARIKLRDKLVFIRDNTDLNFTFDFYNRSGKYKYGVRISFPDNIARLEDSSVLGQRAALMDKALTDMIMYELIKAYRSKYQQRGRLNKQRFWEWFKSGADIQVKEETYFKTVAGIKKERLEIVMRKYSQKIREFFSNPPNI